MEEHALELNRSVGRVEGKLDQLLSSIERHFEDDKTNFAFIGIRLARVERKIYWFTGAGAVVGAFVAYFVKHLV